MNNGDMLRIEALQERLFQLRESWTVGNYQEVRDEMESIQNRIRDIRNKQSEKEV